MDSSNKLGSCEEEIIIYAGINKMSRASTPPPTPILANNDAGPGIIRSA